MAFPGRRARAFGAWLVVLALLSPGSLGARVACGVCPPDCPMHRLVADGARTDLPCHRAAAMDRAADDPAVRASCGHEDGADLAVQVRCRADLPFVTIGPRAVRAAIREARAPRLPALDVPTRPPKDRRSS